MGEYSEAGMFGSQLPWVINKLELHNKHAAI